MKCNKCNGKGYIYTNAFGTNGKLRCDVCGGNGKILSNQQTNFENIAKNEDTLAKWLSDKIHFCREVSCDECKINCANDDVNVTNADLWYAWLKEKHEC